MNSKKLNWGLIVGTGFFAGSALAGVQKVPEAVPGEFVIQMRKTAPGTVQTFGSHLAPLGITLAKPINKKASLYLAKYKTSGKNSLQIKSLNAQAMVMKQIARLPEVEFVEPNYIYHVSTLPEVVPNNPSFGSLWAMKNIGQLDSMGVPGVVGADIKATQAWALSTGSKNVVVAVIDTGIDYNHPNLKNNIWSMPGTLPGDPAVHGYNAIADSLDPMDDNNHGTHCAGTIGGEGDNGIGVVGVNWHVSLMAAKFLDADGAGNLADAIKAIDWATDHGAQIESNSWGGGGFSQALLEAVQRATDKGVLFIAAAGNTSGGNDNDTNPAYPASFELPGIVSVAASTNTDEMAEFSHYGQHSVHLMAPGQNILSTVANNGYDTYSGTSMATPHVSGAAALLLAKEPSLTALQVKQRLLDSTDKIKSVRRRLITGGRLNVYNLLANISPPGFVTIPDSAWSAPITYAISTEHPYPNSSTLHWEIEQPGATAIKVHFAKFATEPTFDKLTITSASTGEVMAVLSGTKPGDFWTPEIDGSKVLLDFTSDTTVNDYGFEIDSISTTTFSSDPATTPVVPLPVPAPTLPLLAPAPIAAQN